MLMFRGLAWNLFSYLVVASLGIAALSAQSGNVSGTVTDSSQRAVLVGAQVKVEGETLTTATDDSGRYKLLGVRAGNVKVTVSYLGFDASTLDVSVSPGGT